MRIIWAGTAAEQDLLKSRTQPSAMSTTDGLFAGKSKIGNRKSQIKSGGGGIIPKLRFGSSFRASL
jgi:hypothetical protein